MAEVELTCPTCSVTRSPADGEPSILVWICECGSRNLWAGGKSVALEPMSEWDPSTDPEKPAEGAE